MFVLYAIGSEDEPREEHQRNTQASTQKLTSTTDKPTSTTSTPKVDVNVQKIARTVTTGDVKPSENIAKPKLANVKVLYVSGSVVNLRSKATTNSRIVSKLRRGTKVRINGENEGKWIPISVDNPSISGWMHGDFLKATKPRVGTASKQTAKKKRSIAAPTTKEIKTAQQQIIRQSINSYSGSCPCPYNRDRAGRRCGGRSAWSRPGGYSPVCYASDVSEARLKTYFKRVKGITY